MEPTDTVRLSPAMVEALGLEGAPVNAANVMAHAIRTAYASDADPFAGMSYGWGDENREALSFVVGLIVEADDRDLPIDPDDIGEIADAAVPFYTADVWSVAARLRDLVDENEVDEWASGADTEQRLKIGLFTVAERVLGALS